MTTSYVLRVTRDQGVDQSFEFTLKYFWFTLLWLMSLCEQFLVLVRVTQSLTMSDRMNKKNIRALEP